MFFLLYLSGFGGNPIQEIDFNANSPRLHTGITIITEMKAYVYVTLKTSVLDPQGQTIQNALRKMGVAGIESVRQGKYFVLTLADGLNLDAARTEVERVAKDVLTNTVIEEFSYRIEE